MNKTSKESFDDETTSTLASFFAINHEVGWLVDVDWFVEGRSVDLDLGGVRTALNVDGEGTLGHRRVGEGNGGGVETSHRSCELHAVGPVFEVLFLERHSQALVVLQGDLRFP